MSSPVTLEELREELASYATKADLSSYPTKADLASSLEIWAGALVARMDDRFERMTAWIAGEFARRDERMHEAFAHYERRMHEEIARHTQATLEAMRTQISVVDDKYRDLPARVTALENARPAPRRKRAR
jgi:hypothetical protein